VYPGGRSRSFEERGAAASLTRTSPWRTKGGDRAAAVKDLEHQEKA
jgi:hypothetical protein